MATVEDYLKDPQTTKAERRLIEACRKGKACKLGPLPPETGEVPTVRAEVIRCLALEATSLHEAGVWLEGARITGTLDLRFTKCRGRLRLASCQFLRLPTFTHAEIGLLSLEGSHLPKGLFAEGIRVSHMLNMKNITAKDTVRLSGAEIEGQLTFEGAKLEGALQVGKLGKAHRNSSLAAAAIRVQKGVALVRMTARGTVDLVGAEIGEQLDCTMSSFEADTQDATALMFQGIKVSSGFVFRDVHKVFGTIDLTAASCAELVDDAPSWSQCSETFINGLRYERLPGSVYSPKTFEARKEWLEKGSRLKGEFFPQPYTQFAKVMRASGHLGEARKALMQRDTILFREAEKADRELLDEAWGGTDAKRGDCGWIWLRLQRRRLWSGLSRRVIGHGHKPERALFWALGAWGVGTLLYFIAYRAGLMVPNSDVIMVSSEWLAAVQADRLAPTDLWTGSGVVASAHYETFFAAIYALDLFLPIVDLGQESTWAVTTPTTFGWGWWLRVGTLLYQIAGWVIGSLGIAAVTGFVQRNDPE